MLRAIRLAWLSIVRQPARSLLGILGVAAIGALLFDMLLLSRGLVLSFSDLLSRTGFDVRVLASDAPPLSGPRLTGASALAKDIAALPEVDDVYRLRLRTAEVVREGSRAEAAEKTVEFIGADPRVRSMWTMVEGEDLPEAPAKDSVIVVNRQVAARQPQRFGRDRCVEHEDHGIVVCPAPLGDALRQPALGCLRIVPPPIGS